MILEFPEFLPDLPALNNPGMTVVKNVIPCGASYGAFPDFTEYSSALGGRCRGAYSAKNPNDGVSYNFAGDGTALYLLGQTTIGVWDNISQVGGYALAAEDNWQITQFGNKILAATITANIQTYTMGSAGLFADLAGTPPKARYIDTVKDFVVVGNTYDAVDGFVPYRVRWSGLGTSTSWAISATTQADYQDLDGKFGWVMQVMGGEYGVIFQEKAITRMDYIGSPVIFQFTTIEFNQGTQYPNSVINVGNLIYFIGLDGFRVFDGNQSLPIGRNKVDRFFADDLDQTYDYLITTAVDYKNSLVMWAYPSASRGQGEINSRILLYNYSPNATKRWSYVDINTEFLFTAISESYTLEQLDDWESAHGLSKNIDVLPYSLDSRIWTGNNNIFASFTSNHKLAYSSTTTFLDAVLETAEAQLTDGKTTDLFLIKPVIDGTAATVTAQIGTRSLQSGTVSYGSSISLDSNGEAQVRSNSRYHRIRVNISGGFNHAIGVEALDFKPSGIR